MNSGRGTCVTIGNFDGVHLGHQALIARSQELASAAGLDLVLITFWPHPRMVLPHGGSHSPLTTRAEKLRLLGALSPSIIELPFTLDMAALSPAEFIRQYLSPLAMRHLVVGHDFTLGRNRSGDIAALRGLAREMDFRVDQVAPFMAGGEPVSSTRLRQRIGAGDVSGAAALLGRPHGVRGTIIHGDARGAGLGFPTANLGGFETLLPAHGVYATRAVIDGQEFQALTNIGMNPTFNGESLRVETHLLNCRQDLYGSEMDIKFIERLRGEKKFSSPGELADQISRDVDAARRILSMSNDTR